MDLPDPAMARSRIAHKLGFFGDRDALHTLTVAGAACVLSLGLVYVGYFLHVLRIARKAPCDSMQSDYLLLFGKHAPGGRLDPDFDARLQREAALHARVTLLGSRYHLARCTLFARQWGIDADVCAAEPALRWRRAPLWRIAGEAAYVFWADLGNRWAQLIGNQRLARLT